MTKSIMANIQLDNETNEQFEKNYLLQLHASILAKEARRQSILSSKKMTREEELWELSGDRTD